MKLPDDERILIVRPCLKTICLDVRPAAKLLSLLLFYARNCSEQEAIYTFSCTQEDLIEGLIDEMDVKTLHRIAIPMLRLLGYLDVDGSSYRYQYTVHLDLIQHVLLHYKDKKQLDKILIVSMKWQLDKCPIELDICPIELVKCPIELDKCLKGIRQMSNSKRGRKPRPQVPLEDVSEEDRLLQIDSDITDKEESNGEHTDTEPFASAHSLDALSRSQSTDTESHSHQDSPIADSNIAPSEGDTDHVPVPAPGHPHRVDNTPGTDSDSHDAALEDTTPLSPEARPVLEAGKEEVNDGRTDSDMAAMVLPDDDAHRPGMPDCSQEETEIEQTASREDVPVVAASPLGTSTVEPGESGKGTLPVAPVNEQAVPAQTQEGKRSGKRKAPEKREEPPKSDTKEVQKRIDTHRGYPLEEKVDIIRERQAVKAWCGLHTLEQYDVVMDEMKRDPYWGKSENYYRIGGLTLLRETSRILAKVERRQASNLRVVPPPEPVDKSKLFSMEHIVLPRKGASR